MLLIVDSFSSKFCLPSIRQTNFNFKLVYCVVLCFSCTLIQLIYTYNLTHLYLSFTINFKTNVDMLEEGGLTRRNNAFNSTDKELMYMYQHVKLKKKNPIVFSYVYTLSTKLNMK